MKKTNNEGKSLTPWQELKALIEDPAMEKSFRQALGSSMPVKAWISAAIGALYSDKKLRVATKNSVICVLMQAATMRLRFEDALGQAYLSPLEKWTYNDKTQKTEYSHTEAQLTVGYRGLIDIAHRDPNVREVQATIVHEHDDFDFYYGSRPFVDHRWDVTKSTEERGRIVAVYSGLRYKDDFYSFEVYPYSDVVEQRNKTLEEKGYLVRYADDGTELFFKRASRRARYKDEVTVIHEGDDTHYALEQMGNGGRLFPLTFDDLKYLPWIKYPIPMIKKTAIRWSAKYWPMSHEFNSAAYFAETEENGITQKIEDAVTAMIPKQIADQLENGTVSAGKRILGSAQGASMATMSNLAAQMANEAGLVQPKTTDGNEKPAEDEKVDTAPAQDDELAKLEAIRAADERKKRSKGNKE